MGGNGWDGAARRMWSGGGSRAARQEIGLVPVIRGAYYRVMSIPAIDIDKLAPEERLQLIGDLWESLRAQPDSVRLTEAAQKADSSPPAFARSRHRGCHHVGRGQVPASRLFLLARIWLLADAFADIEAARQWYEAQRAGLGDEFVDAADAALESVLEIPTAYPVDYRDARRILVERFPYCLYYRAQGDATSRPRVCTRRGRSEGETGRPASRVSAVMHTPRRLGRGGPHVNKISDASGVPQRLIASARGPRAHNRPQAATRDTMPKAAFCRACNSWVWVAPDGSGLCEHGDRVFSGSRSACRLRGARATRPGGTEKAVVVGRGTCAVVVGAPSARPRSSRLAPATTRLCRCTISGHFYAQGRVELRYS